MIYRNIINMDILEEEELYENYINEYGNDSESSESEIIINNSDYESDSESELLPEYNVYDEELIFIENQLGEYFGEDDIMRIDDK